MATLKFDVEIPKRYEGYSELSDALRQFIESGKPVAELIYDGEIRNREALCGILRNLISKENLPITVKKRKEQVFFVLKGE